jgi:hypothetical protein
MGIKPKFTPTDISNMLQDHLDRINGGLISIFQRVGEEFARDAKNGVNISGAFPKGDYTDQTANLRSSIGYVVMHDGAIIAQNFERFDPSLNRVVQENLVNSFGLKWVLMGCAGMDYASYLESRGYNVITSQSMVAMVDLSDRVKKFVKDDYPGANIQFAGVSSIL